MAVPRGAGTQATVEALPGDQRNFLWPSASRNVPPGPADDRAHGSCRRKERRAVTMGQMMLEKAMDVSAKGIGERTFDGVICFGGGDWWYHNRGHYDMQMM